MWHGYRKGVSNQGMQFIANIFDVFGVHGNDEWILPTPLYVLIELHFKPGMIDAVMQKSNIFPRLQSSLRTAGCLMLKVVRS